MKTKFLIILIIAFAFACKNAPKEETVQSEESTETVAMVNLQKVELNIEGMTCSGCENAIQSTIDEFDGIYSAEADHENAIAILEFDSTKVDLSKVEEAINELGYTAQGHVLLKE